MSGLRIIAMTAKGREALLRHRLERGRASVNERRMYESMYREEVESEDPLTLLIIHKSERIAAMVPFESLVVPIRSAMLENGAVLGMDYEVERI